MSRAAAAFGALALFLPFLFPLVASAHNTGVSYQTDKDGYTIDIGYSSPSPQVGDSVQFSFLLRKGTDDAPFSDAWVKISDAQNDVVLATGVHNNPFGGPRLSYVFPRAGTYTIDVRYETDTAAIVETSYTIPVLPATVPWYQDLHTYVVLLGLLEAGTIVAYVLLWRKRRA